MLMFHICITWGADPALAGPGCVLCPAPSADFGFSGDSIDAEPVAHHDFSLVRVLLALVSILLLVWGSVYGHAIECVAAVIAAILVDAVAAMLRAVKER
ncbi:hypothetical protein ACFY9F_36785 [Streptomyces sp. NPDC012421]|uniref:hypothetical protein n=1 Tax=Streptomyces sp. NPDC012421 TaxID=3364832 RepID=UPI0036EAB6A8